MRLDDVDDLGTNSRVDIESNDKVLFKLGQVALALPDVDVGTNIDEGLGWMANCSTELFKFEDAVVKVVAVVHGYVAVGGLGTPNLGWNIDDKGIGTREKVRHGVRIGADISWKSARRQTSRKEQSRRKRKRGGIGSIGGVDSALKVAEGHVVGG